MVFMKQLVNYYFWPYVIIEKEPFTLAEDEDARLK